jgi:SAM-dependent methyltransferase
MKTPMETPCPVCGSSSVREILSMPQMPVFCNVLWDSREAAIGCARGDIRLAYCSGCSFMFNEAFDPELVRYTQRYDNCLHYSKRFREYAESLAAQLVDRHQLHNKLVVDVGCGKGDFLKLLCELGPNRGVGYDPSFEVRDDIEALGDDIEIVRDYYSDEFADHGGDFLCCRHVLEHIQRPGELLAQIRGGLGQRAGVPIFLEVPNGAYTIRNVFVWDVIFEHPCYFTGNSLGYLFELSGYEVSEASEEFEGQYLGIHATTKAPGAEAEIVPPVEDPSVREAVASFSSEFDNLVATWKKELDEIGRDNRRAVIWGAGSKGVTFLNLLDPDGRIGYAVDVSPNKKGKFVAGTGQSIVSVDFLLEYRPNDILVMNPVYQAEIAGMVREMGIEAAVRCL